MNCFISWFFFMSGFSKSQISKDCEVRVTCKITIPVLKKINFFQNNNGNLLLKNVFNHLDTNKTKILLNFFYFQYIC